MLRRAVVGAAPRGCPCRWAGSANAACPDAPCGTGPRGAVASGKSKVHCILGGGLADSTAAHRGEVASGGRAGEDAALVQTIRASTRTGRAAGDETFLARIEKLTARPLRPRKADRPRKARGKPKK